MPIIQCRISCPSCKAIHHHQGLMVDILRLCPVCNSPLVPHSTEELQAVDNWLAQRKQDPKWLAEIEAIRQASRAADIAEQRGLAS